MGKNCCHTWLVGLPGARAARRAALLLRSKKGARTGRRQRRAGNHLGRDGAQCASQKTTALNPRMRKPINITTKNDLKTKKKKNVTPRRSIEQEDLLIAVRN